MRYACGCVAIGGSKEKLQEHVAKAKVCPSCSAGNKSDGWFVVSDHAEVEEISFEYKGVQYNADTSSIQGPHHSDFPCFQYARHDSIDISMADKGILSFSGGRNDYTIIGAKLTAIKWK